MTLKVVNRTNNNKMRLTNVVYQANLNVKIDLSCLVHQLHNVRYNPRIFPGLIYQNRKIGGNCLIFSNGKINCNGACSDFDSGVKRLRRYARIVQRLGYVVRLSEVRLVTASAVHKLSGRINVKSLSRIPDFQYNPELFPAAMLRRQGIHFTCHLGGSVLITGIKHSTDLDNVVFPTMVEIEFLVV